MHADAFDRYQSGASLVHQLDSRVKVLLAVLFILSNALLPDKAWRAFSLSWGFILIASYLSGLGIGYAFNRSFIALPFALIASTVLFSLPGQPVMVISLGVLRLVVTDAGLSRFLSILARSWLSVQAAILLVSVTQFPDLVHALRHLRLPRLLVAIISFMYRYLFVLVDEALRLLRARDARSAVLDGRQPGGSLNWRARVAGNMAGQLFLRSYERSDRVYNAMLARGYDGQWLTLNPHQMREGDWLALIIGFLLMLSFQLVARLP